MASSTSAKPAPEQGGTLKQLCGEDKAKVAALIRQVVQLRDALLQQEAAHQQAGPATYRPMTYVIPYLSNLER